MQHLAELFAYTYPIHKGLMHLLLTLIVIYLLLTQFGVSTKNYVLRVRYFLPLYHGALSIIMFSGILLLAALGFNLTLKISAMILSVILLIAISVIGFKKLKFYAPKNELHKFKRFALFQGLAEILLIVFAGTFKG
ncbi:hypothetical protein LMG7974_00487 [Campylobacter majalis]|uniref:Uncharacterized protein n=1 Tax=Campylobacter majalis TaxID=2790656 RepID=A0ABM8Q423_9BACT|nr:hypothetical protein [Campylobacter majalis]CAD7287608.1 hypothetical protein LMG7974_00487 [Campylobacter majalis]